MKINPQIRSELAQVLTDWDSGKPMRVLELGHNQAMVAHPDGTERIDVHGGIVHRDQEQIYTYVLALIRAGLSSEGGQPLGTFQEFDVVCRIRRPEGMTDQELGAAISLAWKSLVAGWERTQSGHPESRYVTISKSDVPTAEVANG